MTGRKTAIMMLACAGCMAAAQPAAAERIEAGTRAVFRVGDEVRWSAGLHGGFDRREFDAAAGRRRYDLRRLRVRLGLDMLQVAELWAEAGAVDVRLDEQGRRDLGNEWALGTDLHVFESVIVASPVLGRVEWIGLSLTGSYRRSNVGIADDETLDWRERRGGAVVRYGRHERDPEDLMRSPVVTGQVIRAGLIATRVHGAHGGARITDSNNTGLLLGADLLWRSGWVARIETLLMGSENEVQLAVSRFF